MQDAVVDGVSVVTVAAVAPNDRSKRGRIAAGTLAPRRRGRPIVDDKRRRILDAAIKVFAHRGYHGTAVPDVAQAARVSTGTLYHYFVHKEQLVNETYRDAKNRLRVALLDQLADPDYTVAGSVERWFFDIWGRLSRFAQREADAFRFLEMQDHVEYLDGESRQLEISVVAPLYIVAKRVHDRSGGPRVDVTVAQIWGAFVGLVKANRLGYLQLDEAGLREAGIVCWRMFAPEAERAAARPPSRTSAKAHGTRRSR